MTNSKTRNRNIRKIIVRTVITLVCIFLLLLGIIGILANTLVTPKRVTPIVLGLAHDYVDALVDCESIDITIFSTFPDLGIKLSNGSIVNKPVVDSLAGFSSQDTLLSFREFIFSVNPVAFVMQKKIIVKQLQIDDARINAFIDTKGKANWEIFKTDSLAQETDTTAFIMPEFNINNIKLNNVHVTYDDLEQDMFIMVDSLQLRLKGNMSKDNADLSLMFRTAGITSYYQGLSFSQSLPLRFRTQMNNDKINHVLTINNGKLAVGTLELLTFGSLGKTDQPGLATVDMDFGLNASSLSDLLDMIPEHISDIPTKLTASGQIESKVKLTGLLGKDNFPLLSLSFQLKDGSLSAVKHKKKKILEKFDIDFSTIVDITKKTKSSLRLNNFYLKTSSSHITFKGDFDDILNDPTIQAHGKGLINFGHVADRMNFIEGVKMGGLIEFDLSALCTYNDILNSNYGKIDANGTARFDNVFYEDIKEGTTIYTSGANLEFGSNTQDSIRGQLRESLLKGNIKLDSLNLTWQRDIIARMNGLSASFRTTAAPDTFSLAPVMANVRAAGVFLTMGDSVRVMANNPGAAIRLASSKDTRLPEVNARISLDNMGGRLYTMGGRVQKADFRLKINKQKSRTRRSPGNRQVNDSIGRRTSRRDSIYRSFNRDSLRRVISDPTTNVAFRLESQEARTALRNWDLSGSFKFQTMRFRTPYFPIPIQMDDSDLSFTTNSLTLTKARMKMGNSDFTLNGDIEGIRSALLYNGKVGAKLTLDADSLDFNQLINAAVTGSEYGTKSIAEKDSISGIVLDENRELVAHSDTSELGIFVIPRNLDIEFNSNIRNARFAKLNLRRLRGSIILRDQAVQLPRLNLITDVGSARMTMVYKAPDTKGAHLGMEMNMRKVDVGELIGAFPMIDSLAPMLRSFEGVVDCKMTVLTELDSLMNVRLPQTTASCYLNGKDMVLLDGETFSEISKMLMFKNKERNSIDSIAVEMILEDEKLMIFPFQVAMDRYRVAVGGIQNLDMTFDYHISVLKSPIPFKLGLNITGNPDKMKIRLGKAKYKDLFTVAREKSLENTVINVREEMDEKLRKSIYEIIGMDASRPIRRPRSIVPDSLKQTFFKPDSTDINPADITDSIPKN